MDYIVPKNFNILRVDEEKELKDGKSCGHPGCLYHITHPCEGCGRISGRTKNQLKHKNFKPGSTREWR
jgi:hypothetical protein